MTAFRNLIFDHKIKKNIYKQYQMVTIRFFGFLKLTQYNLFLLVYDIVCSY